MFLVFKVGSLRSKRLHAWGPVRDLSCLHSVNCSPCPHMVEGTKQLSRFSVINTLNLFVRALSIRLANSRPPNSSPLNNITLGIRLLHSNLNGAKQSHQKPSQLPSRCVPRSVAVESVNRANLWNTSTLNWPTLNTVWQIQMQSKSWV